MTRHNQISEEIVEKCVRAKGLEITRVPRQVGKTPDFRIMLDDETVVIEVKEKQDDPQRKNQITEELKHRSEAASSKTIKYTNTIAGRLDEAAFQLAASEASNCIRVAWMNFTGSSPEVDSKLLFKTLFGGQDLITEDSEKMSYCFFYNESTFFKHRERLDVVIESHVENNRIHLRLYLNPLSSRQEIALDSRIIRTLGFATKHAIDETNPQVLVLDADIPRKDSVQKCIYLKKKYGLRQLEEFNSSVISVTMRFNLSDFLPPEE
jgi:hypothetical protein